jgi:hypothetical protein
MHLEKRVLVASLGAWPDPHCADAPCRLRIRAQTDTDRANRLDRRLRHRDRVHLRLLPGALPGVVAPPVPERRHGAACRQVAAKGLHRIDEAKLNALDEATFLKLRKSSWLILAYAQLPFNSSWRNPHSPCLRHHCCSHQMMAERSGSTERGVGREPSGRDRCL